ncbi:hypothetical protein L1987_85635 [Smallanthus sonchifolius]|uniref:Uncharacterized protein n=1 Tax=Smallanthus sonchifolius TaxID=185202 RepID=A0ACB8XYP6_9ASTR|nr:hypothetical protein L1987_85635 [Smallanthus sonchifolius]
MESSNEGKLQIYDYMNVLSLMKRKVLYRGELGEFNLNSIREGIKLQLKEVSVLNDISGDQIEKIEKKQVDMIIGKNEVNAYDPIKKLNDMKISLIYIEWIVLRLMRMKVLYRGELGEFNLNSMREGIKLQLKEVGECFESNEKECFESNEKEGIVLRGIRRIQLEFNEGGNQIAVERSRCNLQIYDYRNVLSLMRRKVLYREELGEFNLKSMREGIKLQLKEVGVLKDISGDQTEKIEKKQIDMIIGKNEVNAYDPIKNLKDLKITLIYIEWYMNTRKPKGGYYDLYGD